MAHNNSSTPTSPDNQTFIFPDNNVQQKNPFFKSLPPSFSNMTQQQQVTGFDQGQSVKRRGQDTDLMDMEVLEASAYRDAKMIAIEKEAAGNRHEQTGYLYDYDLEEEEEDTQTSSNMDTAAAAAAVAPPPMMGQGQEGAGDIARRPPLIPFKRRSQ